MKPFDLEEAKAGKPMCTREGNPVRILCFDRLSDTNPLLGLIQCGNNEIPMTYTKSGERYESDSSSRDDLFMVSVKKEGWVNIYPERKLGSTYIYATKKEALYGESDGAIACVKVEWEEQL